MGIFGLKPVAVVHHHQIAVARRRLGTNHFAAGHHLDLIAGTSRQINPFVISFGLLKRIRPATVRRRHPQAPYRFAQRNILHDLAIIFQIIDIFKNPAHFVADVFLLQKLIVFRNIRTAGTAFAFVVGQGIKIKAAFFNGTLTAATALLILPISFSAIAATRSKISVSAF